MKKSYFYYTVTPILFVAALVAAGLYLLQKPVVEQREGYIFYLKPGTSKQRLVAELNEAGVINHPLLFAIYAYPQFNSQLKTGEYFFPTGSTSRSIWQQITTGKGLYYRSFAIIPGWTFQQLRVQLNKAEGLRHFTADLTDKQVMTDIANENVLAEGQFFPETYYYTRGNLDLVILQRAYDLMQKRLQEAWETRAADLPFKSAYEALIAASLVEKEAYLKQECPIIASVIVNRLRKNMLLQIDPTVIYGMGSRYDGKIHKENLRENTPYNTYVNKGLPPTPIAMPSMAAIEAVMHPATTEFYYFVARGDGSHEFSKTLTEHHAAVDAAIKRKVGAFNELRVKQYVARILQQANLSITSIA
jgi:UPF0755 protein